MESDSSRPGPDLVASMDQWGAALSTNAAPFASYFYALQAEGFDRTEAFQLVRDAQAIWLEGVMGASGGSEDPPD